MVLAHRTCGAGSCVCVSSCADRWNQNWVPHQSQGTYRLAASPTTPVDPDGVTDPRLAVTAGADMEQASPDKEMGTHAGLGDADDAQLAAALAATASGDEPPTATEERRSRSRSPRREGQ